MVLVVDDDPAIRELATAGLNDAGLDTTEAVCGGGALVAARTERPDLIVLDLGLPCVDGLEVLARVRDAGGPPVVILTGRAEEKEMLRGLESGADDYVTKPFSERELAARVKAVMRRMGPDTTPESLTFGNLTIDIVGRSVHVGDAPVDLTAREFDLLTFLARDPNHVFSRSQLLDHVWGSSDEWQQPSTVTEHVHRLRGKLEVTSNDCSIVTVRGAGYKFVPSKRLRQRLGGSRAP